MPSLVHTFKNKLSFLIKIKKPSKGGKDGER
jgi:hypothetical protein